MQKGGYQIVDLKNKKLTIGVGMVYDGIYEIIEGTRKATLLSGINIGGTEYHDTYIDFTVNGSDFIGTVFGKKITVTNNDVVTVTNN